MTERTVIKNAVGGRFVSSEYAEANPDTTYVQTVASPDRLTEIRAEIVRLTESEPSLTLNAVPGIELTGTDPLELYETALLQIRAALGVE